MKAIITYKKANINPNLTSNITLYKTIFMANIKLNTINDREKTKNVVSVDKRTNVVSGYKRKNSVQNITLLYMHTLPLKDATTILLIGAQL